MTLSLRYTTDGTTVFYLGHPATTLEGAAFGGPDVVRRQHLAQDSVRFLPGLWRHLGWSLCLHPEFGTGLPLATDGTRVVFYISPASIQVVHKTNLIGPIGPWAVEVSDWNYATNTPKMRAEAPHIPVLKELDARYAYAAEQHPENWPEVHAFLVTAERDAGGEEMLAKSVLRQREGRPESKARRRFSAVDEAIRLLKAQ